MEHVQSLGRDVVLMAIPMGTSRPFTSSSGTAFPSTLALGALLVATDKQSATHPRSAILSQQGTTVRFVMLLVPSVTAALLGWHQPHP